MELCEEKRILDKISNGKTYQYLKENRDIGLRLLTDFSFGDIEIEIKSNYILKKQGGLKTYNAKRKAVEVIGKKYLMVLDKDYSEFLELIKDI